MKSIDPEVEMFNEALVFIIIIVVVVVVVVVECVVSRSPCFWF
jgi:flagellar basal body-associated protein FliL